MSALACEHDAGPSDHKIWYTTSITSASVGRGRTIPEEMRPPPMLESVAALEGQIGYSSTESSNGDSPLPTIGLSAPSRSGRADQADLEEVALLLGARLSALETFLTARDEMATVCIEGATSSGEVRELVFGRHHDGPTPIGRLWCVAAQGSTWRRIAAGESNIGSLLRSGDVRYECPGDANEQAGRCRLVLLA